MMIPTLCLPCDIWRDIVSNWLGSLREIVRVDSAFSFSAEHNPLLDLYIHAAFSFPECAGVVGGYVLTRLTWWMRRRQSFISRIHLTEQNPANRQLPPQWQGLIMLSGETMEFLKYDSSLLVGSSIILSWATRFLVHLQKLELSINSNVGFGCITELLQNNSCTLTNLTIHVHDDSYLWRWKRCWYPCLRVFCWSYWECSNLWDFVRRCPNLTALCITAADSIDPRLLVTAIAERCPLLQRLQLDSMDGLDVKAMLQIAKGCPMLEFLGLWECFDALNEQFAQVVSVLPRLHTLSIYGCSSAIFLKIVTQCAPSLRYLDLWSTYTYSELRQITAALPQLIGLSIHGVDFQGRPNNVQLMEHCVRLEVLGVYGLPAQDFDSVLNSAATYCHSLHTLKISDATAQCTDSLNAVLGNCPQLRMLRASNFPCIEVLTKRPNLVISEEHKTIAEWDPEWTP